MALEWDQSTSGVAISLKYSVLSTVSCERGGLLLRRNRAESENV
jgi:hypothetical protein